MRVTFSKNHGEHKKGETADVSDFEAGRLVGEGVADAADDATDPASPLNLAGPDGHPLAQARIPANPEEAGKESVTIAGVEIKEAEAPVEPEEDGGAAPDSATKPGKRK